MREEIVVFWFRRDLRLHDNAGFLNALNANYPVLPIFIFDTEILSQLPKNDARVSFIYKTLQAMQHRLQKENNRAIALYHGNPADIFQKLIRAYKIHAVYTNHDYEPYALYRDEKISKLLADNNISFKTFKDQVIFEKGEVQKDSGEPYVVYTPYMRKWKQHFDPDKHLNNYASENYLNNLIRQEHWPNLTLSQMGFEQAAIQVPEYCTAPELINNYEATRNFPAKTNGTSHLGPHLRFGTVSIREIMRKAIAQQNEVFWNELIWRAFFMQILWHFPHTVNNAFKPKYDRIKWRNNEDEFKLWQSGQTGYPLVDAGMRELNATGYMHNRVRMLTASFLCKHLLIDWRWGEAYFAEKLLDFELASNLGNWQWASGSGVDAAPYFRIFNPITQATKFDKAATYIRKWVPEFETDKYPGEIVIHKEARERCLRVYKEAVQ